MVWNPIKCVLCKYFHSFHKLPYLISLNIFKVAELKFLFNKLHALPMGSFDHFFCLWVISCCFLCLLIFVVVKTGHLK